MAELPLNHPAGLTPAFQEQNSLAERGFDASRATRKRGQRLAKSLAHPFVLPPRSQPSKAMRKSENGRGYPSERVSTGRRVPRGPGVPRLFRWCQAVPQRGGEPPPHPGTWRGDAEQAEAGLLGERVATLTFLPAGAGRFAQRPVKKKTKLRRYLYNHSPRAGVKPLGRLLLALFSLFSHKTGCARVAWGVSSQARPWLWVMGAWVFCCALILILTLTLNPNP